MCVIILWHSVQLAFRSIIQLARRWKCLFCLLFKFASSWVEYNFYTAINVSLYLHLLTRKLDVFSYKPYTTHFVFIKSSMNSNVHSVFIIIIIYYYYFLFIFLLLFIVYYYYYYYYHYYYYYYLLLLSEVSSDRYSSYFFSIIWIEWNKYNFADRIKYKFCF